MQTSGSPSPTRWAIPSTASATPAAGRCRASWPEQVAADALRADADRAAHAGAAEPAVAVRVLAQVLLVIVLGVVEHRRRQDLGGDRRVAGAGEAVLIGRLRRLGRALLRLTIGIDARAVLG